MGFFILIHKYLKMIVVCPHCGFELPNKLNDGLIQCCHCNQLVESSDLHKLLSAAWLVRKNHFTIEQLKWHTQLDDEFAVLVYTYVHDCSYSHADFLTLLKRLGVANKSYINFE